MSSRLPTTRMPRQGRPHLHAVEPSLDVLSFAQLRAEARRRGLPMTGTKADLIERLTHPLAREPRRPRSLAQEAAEAPNRSVYKAETLKRFLVALDWRVTLVSEPGARVTLTAKRDKHVFVVVWENGSYRYTSSSHTRPDGLQVKVLNVSAFKRLAAMS